MKYVNAKTGIKIFAVNIFMLAGLGLVFQGWCRAGTADRVEKNVEKSIEIRKKIQEKKDSWAREKAQLGALYDQLTREYEMLVSENNDLKEKLALNRKANSELLKQKQTAMKIRADLLPFLKRVYDRLNYMVRHDPPFLENERFTRMDNLGETLNDSGISIAEKYRKVMEALFIEAGYGTTIEVYQDRVRIAGQKVLGNIFRLGRVSLFFLSLDNRLPGYFNVAENRWQVLDQSYLPAIQEAVEIAQRRRPSRLLCLPLGRLAKKAGEQ